MYDLSKFEDIELGGINTSDYPDFVDTFISSAYYEGIECSDEQLDWLNEQNSFVYDKVLEYLF